MKAHLMETHHEVYQDDHEWLDLLVDDDQNKLHFQVRFKFFCQEFGPLPFAALTHLPRKKSTKVLSAQIYHYWSTLPIYFLYSWFGPSQNGSLVTCSLDYTDGQTYSLQKSSSID